MKFGPYPARVERVIDGDTIILSIDLGFDHLISGFDLDGHPRLSCRVYGINAPELSTPQGQDALAYASTLLPPKSRCLVTSHGWDKYGGRFDGTITILLPPAQAQAPTDFATLMLNAGHAVPFK